MKWPRYLLQRLAYGGLLLLGVTLISFALMVHYGPDRTYQLLGKNPTPEQIEEVRTQLGYDQPFFVRYGAWMGQFLRLDLGLSDSNGEPVLKLLSRTLPVTLLLVLPGFLLGNLLGLGAGMLAAWHRGRLLDRVITAGSVAGLSLSFLVVIILLQVLLCTPYGLNLFPARGWRVDGLDSYLWYVTVPTLALVIVTLGYNARFYRAVIAEELNRDHVRTARAFGATALEVLGYHALRNSAVPIITRVLYSIPLVLVTGSLLLETYFGIPGIGRAAFDAITSGDQPVLLAIISLTGLMLIIAQLTADALYRIADPRIGGS